MGWFLAETVPFLKLMAQFLEHILGNSKPKMGQLAIEIRITSGVVTGSSGHPSGIHLRAEWTKGLRNLEQASGDNRRTKLAAPPWWLRFPS